VAAFLSQNNLSGKTLIPFCTHGSGGQANLFTDIAKLCPSSKIQKGFAVDGKSAKQAETKIKEWLQDLGLIN
jgi:flavodoxin